MQRRSYSRIVPFTATASRHLREFFAWQVSNFFIALWLGVVIGAWGLREYRVAYVFLVLSWLWGTVCWLSSKFLKEKQLGFRDRSERWKRQHAFEYQRSRREYMWWQYGGCLALALIMMAALYGLRNSEISWRLSLLEDWFEPASDPMPIHKCGPIPDGATVLFLGDGPSATVVHTSLFPHTVLEINGRKRLVLHRDNAGRIGLSLDIYDRAFKIIASIEDNHFRLNKNDLAFFKRPDLSTMVVDDRYKDEVFRMRYLNPRAIRLRGILNYSDYGQIRLPPPIFDGVCIGNAGKADISF